MGPGLGVAVTVGQIIRGPKRSTQPDVRHNGQGLGCRECRFPPIARC
jgi:hypothetical protein